MKIEQNVMTFNAGTSTTTNYYIDLARCLSAINGKMISQTKRSDGKYKPLTYLVRVRVLGGYAGGVPVPGTLVVGTLNSGYPTRNAVVLAGAARDAMLKSAGVSRGNLESYQKELRLKFDCDMTDATSLSPGATSFGFGPDYANETTHVNAFGNTNAYDYNELVYDDPDGSGTDIRQTLVVLGDKTTSSSCLPVIYNWKEWRHSYTPSSANDDIAPNAFSYVMQQSSTADEIIDIVGEEADEKPYDLADFQTKYPLDVVSTDVGNPTTQIISAPLGLLKVGQTVANQVFQIEVVGVSEL